jgi:hypothetical protein
LREEEKKLNLLRELETQNAFVKAVLTQLPAAIVVADADTGQIRMSNEEAHRIVRHEYGHGKRLEDYGNTFIREAHGTDGRRYASNGWPLDRALRGETVVGEEIELFLRDQSRVIVRVNAGPIRVGDEVVAAVVDPAGEGGMARRLVVAQADPSKAEAECPRVAWAGWT